MVRILTSAILLLAAFMTVDACKWCQCLRDDGAHCCVYTTGKSDTDCHTLCQQVHDANGNKCSTSSLNYKCATLSECNYRSKCRESHACLT
ncbi:hypothetical protein K435DRAFT_783924 [Dendrothele bispora CBS 962.96]|uniref:Uncharacterized protein n=1 Tax=Dendrothele bispora (strain CBS 962.96) TaxID=1314807 RepID=A0A4S8L6A5_DENBC|nr:hypothetical protein K435DRAFT_783924 [Dendrothele bispora CBS 962.96]